MLRKLRQAIADFVAPTRRVEVHENWQATAEERLGDHTDKPFDHYAQYYATVDGEHCNIGFDIYVADVEGHPEARLNVWDTTGRWNMYHPEENPKPQIQFIEGEE